MDDPAIALKKEEAPTNDEQIQNNNDGKEIPVQADQAGQKWSRSRYGHVFGYLHTKMGVL